MLDKDCLQCVARIGWFGVGSSVLLALFQGAVGFTSGSKVCLAIALQSISNIISAGAIIITEKVSNKPTNEEFPYGYGKVEYVAAAFTCLAIAAMTIYLSLIALGQLLAAPGRTMDFAPILVGVFSIIANEVMFQYTLCVGKHSKSPVIMANAFACRADSYAAGVVAVCALGSWLGVERLDAVGALVIVVLIFRVLSRVFLDALRGLLDHSANDRDAGKIEDIALSIDAVRGLRRLRTKHMGRKIWAEMDIVVDAGCTIENGQRIAHAVRDALLAKIDELERVIVRFGPEKPRAKPTDRVSRDFQEEA
ncbi:MAG: cation transporter [Desulfovibrionaceae bacterium]|nr:cation transporter [Desulfovibrionaceae bacterium]